MRGLLGELLAFADERWTDALGNLFARLRANDPGAGESPPQLMLAAHMDEIGLVVTSIEASGALAHGSRRRARSEKSTWRLR